jgi:hypothetical protein
MDEGLLREVAEAIRRADEAICEARWLRDASQRLLERAGTKSLSYDGTRERRQDRILPMPRQDGTGSGGGRKPGESSSVDGSRLVLGKARQVD